MIFCSFQKVYKEFEKRVLEGTHEYYSKDSETAMEELFVKQRSFIAYIKHVQNRLNDEIKRAKLLHETTERALMKVCYDTLIEKHLETFDAEFRVRVKVPTIAKWAKYDRFSSIDFAN